MSELLRDAVKWLIGGGALTIATFAGTTAYQWGQLAIEREKNLRAFLDKYVEIATKGSLDERIRFVLYWDSLQVSDKIGVDFARYRAALQNEVATGVAVARAEMAAELPPREAAVEPRPEPVHPPEEEAPPAQQRPLPMLPDAVELTPQQQHQQQQVYYETRQASVTRLAVPDLERVGIEALLQRDLALAQATLEEAWRLWPDYHNLAEFRDLLSENEARLRQGDDAAWREVYDTILKRFSWGIPSDLLAALRSAAAG